MCFKLPTVYISAGSVILESPPLPVMEGETVTLRCIEKASLLNRTVDFYKNGLFILVE